ncbi:uncharacterized protein VTP21DRAFT_6096 [Calcarisporiella thermophila]|uniref:uncharacterized protein n=1 Tax=Calcarisporiella thermophila TaxID=911321 RepID=UPI0037429788
MAKFENHSDAEDSKESQAGDKKMCWVTLITRDSYASGVKVLAESLRQVASRYPLVVMHTQAVSPHVLRELEALPLDSPLRLHPIDPVVHSHSLYIFEHYVDTWTKLAVWRLEEYGRCVFLDADMLVRRNMDELMTMPLEEGWIAASYACVCNPKRIKSYPSHWKPEACAYTYQARSAAPPAALNPYFNSGLMVLTPSLALYSHMLDLLSRTSEQFHFPDQDFLNIVFRGQWKPIPYYYNALKTLRSCHAKLWRDEEVRCVHYILKKPWEEDMEDEKTMESEFYELYQWWYEVYHEVESRVGVRL